MKIMAVIQQTEQIRTNFSPLPTGRGVGGEGELLVAKPIMLSNYF